MPEQLPVPVLGRSQVLFDSEAAAIRIAAPYLQEQHGDQPLQAVLKLQTGEELLVFYTICSLNVAWQYAPKGWGKLALL
jgi:hypothetical protein